MNSILNANNRKLITSLSDPEHHFKFGNLIKNAIFDKKRLFSSLIYYLFGE